MYKGFWNTIKKPFFALAPMADVTDAAFRSLIAKYGRPDVMFTEFVSADGLFLGGKETLMKDLVFSESERPIVAQFFTAKPRLMEKAARLAVELGFDGIDINMGCPDRNIEKQGAGAALMKNPKLAEELIYAAKEGAGELPVSIKTRLGYNESQLEEWLPQLLKAEPAVITIHARTRAEMSKVPVHWEEVKRAVEIRDYAQVNSVEHESPTLILGNGGIMSLKEAEGKIEETGADGIMLGKAVFGNPWLFTGYKPTVREKLEAMVEHTKLFEELLPHKNFNIMKKHYKAYMTGFPACRDAHGAGRDGVKELRMKLMETKKGDEVAVEVEKYLSTL